MTKYTITYGGFDGKLDRFVTKQETKEQAMEHFFYIKGKDRVIHKIEEGKK